MNKEWNPHSKIFQLCLFVLGKSYTRRLNNRMFFSFTSHEPGKNLSEYLLEYPKNLYENSHKKLLVVNPYRTKYTKKLNIYIQRMFLLKWKINELKYTKCLHVYSYYITQSNMGLYSTSICLNFVTNFIWRSPH